MKEAFSLFSKSESQSESDADININFEKEASLCKQIIAEMPDRPCIDYDEDEISFYIQIIKYFVFCKSMQNFDKNVNTSNIRTSFITPFNELMDDLAQMMKLCKIPINSRDPMPDFNVLKRNLLKLIDDKLIDLDTLYGSWAGAYGYFQFMPTSISKYAIDYDKNGKIELKVLNDSIHVDSPTLIEVPVGEMPNPFRDY